MKSSSLRPGFVPANAPVVSFKRQPIRSRFTLGKIAKGAGTVILSVVILALFVGMAIAMFDHVIGFKG